MCNCFIHFAALIVWGILWVPFIAQAQETGSSSHDKSNETRRFDPPFPSLTRQQTTVVDTAILEAFAETHDGYSSDEVLLQQGLNDAFLKNVHQRLAAAEFDRGRLSDGAVNWRLLSLRKAGKLTTKTTRRRNSDTSDVLHLAEIAVRTIQDQHRVSSDRVLTEPELRKQFNEQIKMLNDQADLYLARKAALQLRKSRKLRPELISRVADWGREVSTHSVMQLQEDPSRVPEHPGVYLFRDQTGYLYIGQSDNLRERLEQHLDQSHNLSLASYLKDPSGASIEVHAFDPKSRAREVRVRRAYESELIRSRKPRFNVQP